MAASQPFRIRDFRYLNGTAFKTAFTNAATAAWNVGNSIKLRVQTVDLSGLEYPSEPDETMSAILHEGFAPIPTLRTGNVQFAMFLEGAGTAITNAANPLATLLSLIQGGIQHPATVRSEAFSDLGATDAGTLDMTGIGTETEAGSAILSGVKGDGTGGGEVRSILTEVSANQVELNMELPGVLTTETIVYSTTVYMFNTTQQYIEFLSIGKGAEDQHQTINSMGSFGFSGLGPGEKPLVEFDLQSADHKSPVAADRGTIDTTNAPSGNQPAVDKGIGGFYMSDTPTSSAATRARFPVADITIDPNVRFVQEEGLNGVNGIENWVRVPGLPTAEFTIPLKADAAILPGLFDDFNNETVAAGAQSKNVMFQFGHTIGRCVAIEFPRAYLTAQPVHNELNEKVAVRVTVVGTAGLHAEGTAATALANSPMRIHFF